MLKWIKRILITVAGILAVVIITALVGIHMYRGRPTWYRTRTLSVQERKETVNRADQKFADVFSWAASVHAQQIRLSRGGARPEAPIGPKTFTISEDELNTFIESWQSPEKAQLHNWLKNYFSEGRLVLEDGAIILAGQSKDLGALISVELDPSIDSAGQLNLVLQSVQAGRLPLPRGMYNSHIQPIHTWLQGRVVENQPLANLDGSMSANESASAAEMSRLLLDSLDGNSSDPILFVPFNLKNFGQMLTVHVAAVKITQGLMTLTLAPLTANDRDAVLKQIKRPYGVQPAAVVTDAKPAPN